MKLYLPFIYTLFFCSCFVFTGCGGDEDPEPEPCGVLTIDGTAKINGANHDLTIAQLNVSEGGAVFGDTYQFIIAGINSACTEQSSIAIQLTIPSGAQLSGPYTITDFFNVADGQAYGSFTIQVVDPVSQMIDEFESGIVRFTPGPGNQYEIDLNALTVGGETIGLEVTHSF